MSDREDRSPYVERLGLRRRNLPERDPCFHPGQAVLVKTDSPVRRRGWIRGIRDKMLVVEFAGGQESLVSAGDVSPSRRTFRKSWLARLDRGPAPETG